MTKFLKASLIAITFTATSSTVFANNEVGIKTFQQVCTACHSSGGGAAPQLGNKAAWKARIAKGKEALYSSALNGFGGMPARGGVSSLTDAQVKAVVNYMIAKGS